MPNASGLFKVVAYKKETVFGTAPAASGAQLLRRISVDVTTSKDTYGSNEIRPEMQQSDFRHGVKRIAGKISGDISAKTYADFYGSFCKRLFTAGVSATAQSITIAGAGPYTLTRASGSYLTDGFKIGHVVRLSVGSFNAANSNKNLFVTAVTATVLTVTVVNSTYVSALVAEGPVTGATVSVVGKQTWVASTGQVEESYSLEQYQPDMSPAVSEVSTGCKINGFTANLPATGIATNDFDIIGQNVTTSASQYFTSPTAATTTGSLAAVNGLLSANGSIVGVLTGLTITGQANYTGDPVVGSNVVPAFYPGIVKITGQATAYFADVTLRDAFLNETEIGIMAVFTEDNTATSNFVSYIMHRVKLGGFSKSDGDGAIVVTVPFTALLNKNGGSGTATEFTTMLMQDSAA
jgi:hypothetical protein